MPDDIKKATRGLELKISGLYNQGDLTANRDFCCVCGEWTEDLNEKTGRCNSNECNAMLVEFAIRNGLARKTKSGMIVGDFNRAAKMFPPQKGNIEQPEEEDPDMCYCKKAVKRPNDYLCIECRMKANHEEMRHQRKHRR